MKKSYLKSILLCIPICLMLYDGNVKAADVCYLNKNIHKVTVSSASKTLSLSELGFGHSDRAIYHKFTIEGNPAFCMNPGLPLGSQYTMKNGVAITDTTILRIYGYYEKNKDDRGRFFAQAALWAWSKGFKDLTSAKPYIKAAVTEYYGQDVGGYFDSIISSIYYGKPTTTKLYWWDPVGGGNFQKFISPRYDNEKCEEESIPEEPTVPVCNIDVDTREMINSCSGINSGTIKEFTYGDCYNYYTGWKNNEYGEPISSNVGTYCQTYCLKELVQTYPGNISKAVNAGRYIVWPNNNVSSNTYKINAKLATYPLKLTLTQKCRIMVNQQQLLSDYQAASQAEASAYLSGDGYGNYVGQVFQNYNNSCSWYQSNQNSKQSVYNTANANYNSCMDANRIWNTQKTCLEWADETKKTCISWESGWDYNEGACASEKTNLDQAGRDLNAANNALNVCNSYKSTFDRANSVLSTFNTCISSNFTNGLDFSADYSVGFEGEGNYTGEYQLYESESNKTCDNCSGYSGISLKSNQYRYSSSTVQADLINRIAQVENREVNMELTKTYDLKEDSANGNYYYYVNKDTNESTNLANRGNNYSTIGFSNMPVSYSSKVGKKYNIKLNLNDITSNSIKSEFKEALLSQEYVCNYEVTKTTPSECICPSGTKHEGESLDCLISNMNESGQYKYTCSEAQYVYCDSETNISDYVCPGDNSNKLTCPNDHSMDLTACVNEGYSYNYCVNTFCNGKHYVCPSGTNEGMNLDACVIPMILKGYSEKDAYEYCKDTTCPYGGIKVIYRTISLQNPFPSYNADKTVDQTGLSVGMFNDTVKGRYPGKNWNSTVIVKSKILNNRNVDGDSVYSKEPLYTFTLTTDTIKNIRKYNKSQKDSYSNFDLNCLMNNSAACVSEEFVHNTSYGLTGGTCNRKLTASNFYTCDD